MRSAVAEVKTSIAIPNKYLHVIRNPFDNIATMVLRKLKLRKDAGETKVCGTQTVSSWFCACQMTSCSQGVRYLALTCEAKLINSIAIPRAFQEYFTSDAVFLRAFRRVKVQVHE